MHDTRTWIAATGSLLPSRLTATVARLALGTTLAISALVATAPSRAAALSAPVRAVQTTTGSCHRPTPAPVTAVRVPGSSIDWTITSFDGTLLRAHWFPVARQGAHATAPTVLMGPGWGSAGDTNPSAPAGFGGLSIAALNAAGFNVLTWDPRGFGQSGGTVEIDSGNYEARDVSRLIDWVATMPGVELAGPHAPRIGMVGASYGGGIQFVSAATDCRIDAIVPTIAWHSLMTSLYKANTFKTGWDGLLYTAAAQRLLDLHIREAYQQGVATGMISPDDAAWFAQHTSLVSKVHVPTLIVQGTVDTLFTLDEGVENYENLRARHVPTSMIWFCGGHGVCLTNPGNQRLIEQATISWLDRYLKRQSAVHTGPQFRFVDQNGAEYAARGYPIPLATPLKGSGSGTLALVAAGGSGPAHPPANSKDPLARVTGGITPAAAANAVNITVSSGSRDALVVGAPRVTLTYRGTVQPGVRPTRVFAQLVDDSTRLVVGNQITPIEVTLDGRTHTVSVPLELVAFAAHPGHKLTLQLVASTVAYAQPRLGGSIRFSHVGVQLPVAAHLEPRRQDG